MVDFPIASIVFEGDFRLAILQALSIDRLYDGSDLTEYTVILNGQDNMSLRSAYERDLKPAVSSDFWAKINFLVWEDLLSSSPRVGYYDQQALKLSLGNYYSSEFFLMLDAKNHFVRPVSSASFLQAGRPFAPRERVNNMWRPYLKNSFEAMGVEMNDLSIMMPSITPYLMYTCEVRKLVEYLTEKYSSSLTEALVRAGGTEFLLYYASIYKRSKELYHEKDLPVRTLFTSWPQEHEVVLRLIRELSDHEVPMFGLHRNRLPQLSRRQIYEIEKIWRTYLLRPWESAEWFLVY